MRSVPECDCRPIVTLSFVDFVGEFPYFRDEVLPRLEAKGLPEKNVTSQ